MNFLYKNLGANTFTRITSGSLVNDNFFSRNVSWTDMDLDGDLDLFVTNENNQNENIYRNNGQGSFTKLTTGPLVNNGADTMSSSWGDYDNDGDLDVFLANDQSNNALFRNDGNFTFTKVIADTVSKTPGNSFSSSWSDVDNDGDLDLFVTNAFKVGTQLVNYFYLNNGNSSFTRVNNALTSDSSWSYGCAFGDYDNDGFEDLAVATCRFNGSDKQDLLYHNDGNANTWLTVKLTGTISNRAAIGAKVKANIGRNPVWQLREISAQNAYCSQNDQRTHFGLGDATLVDSLKIEWPSGRVDYSTAIQVNQIMTSIEIADAVLLIEVKAGSSGLRLFPNPSDGKLQVRMDNMFHEGDKIFITDFLGRQLAEIQVQVNEFQHTLDLKKYDLPPGNYFVNVQSGSQKFKQAFLISH